LWALLPLLWALLPLLWALLLFVEPLAAPLLALPVAQKPTFLPLAGRLVRLLCLPPLVAPQFLPLLVDMPQPFPLLTDQQG